MKNEKTDWMKVLDLKMTIDNRNKFSLMQEMYRINQGIEFIEKIEDIKKIKKALKQIKLINNRLLSTIDHKGEGKHYLPAMLFKDE